MLSTFIETSMLRSLNILGIGDWGLGIGDWGLGIGPNPQSPIPNPHNDMLLGLRLVYVYSIYFYLIYYII